MNSPGDITVSPTWVRCPMCDEPWCMLHGEHAADCPCQNIDTWAKHDLSPYDTTIGEMLSWSARKCVGWEGEDGAPPHKETRRLPAHTESSG